MLPSYIQTCNIDGTEYRPLLPLQWPEFQPASPLLQLPELCKHDDRSLNNLFRIFSITSPFLL